VVVQPALLVALLTRESVALLGEATDARLAIGQELLAVNPGAGVIDDKMTAAEVVAHVIGNRWSGITRKGIAHSYECDPAFVVHDV
jgi:hypothetical protein